MLPTLFHIPHRLGPLPVFGFGWVLLAWTVFGLVTLVRSVRRQGWNADTRSYLPVLLLIAAGIAFVLPMLEERDLDGRVLGLPIRGYGVMLLAGVVAGLGAAVYRAQRMGLNPEHLFSLAFWMFVGGIGGARLFFVVQYWRTFQRPSWTETAAEILKFTEGGLVVYGALLGGVLAAALYLAWQKLPILAVADLVAPSLVLGLALGRLGCLCNGCCYGGVCETPTPAIRFPGQPPAPPYLDQLERGTLLGLTLRPRPAGDGWDVLQVAPGSLADRAGIEPGDHLLRKSLPSADDLQQALRHPDRAGPVVILLLAGKPPVRWMVSDLPARSLPTHPAQIYSSINALLLFLLLWNLYPFRRRDGAVFATLLTLYPITRILLELVRTDEPGVWGTPLTISQWVSLGLLLLAGGLWVYVLRQPPGSRLPPAEPAAT